MNMKRIFASILCLLFVVGVLIVPIIHKAHCVDSGNSHESDHCSFCQLAHAPLMAAVPHVGPTEQLVSVDSLLIPQLLIPVASLRDTTKARAPPVA